MARPTRSNPTSPRPAGSALRSAATSSMCFWPLARANRCDLPALPSSSRYRVRSTSASAFALTIRTPSRRPSSPTSRSRLLSASAAPPVLYSTLETVTISSTDRRVVYVAPAHFEAPNWSRDGNLLPLQQRGPHLSATRCRRHSHDRSTPASPTAATTTTASRPTASGWRSATLRSPITSRSFTSCPSPAARLAGSRTNSPSYWHGWSPDGKTLAYCAQRNGEFDIYTIPVAGGEETRLTTAQGLDDGPDYSPDGQYIYFNSERTGRMQIWRMHPDGSAQEQVTFDDFNNWFPHISPDGKWMVFLSYEKDVTGHPPNKDVQLRLMTLADGQIKVARQALRRPGHDQRPFLVAR